MGPLDFDYVIKFLVLGNSGVGKTSCLVQYVDNTFSPNFISTVGIDFREKVVEFRQNDASDDAGVKNDATKLKRIHLQVKTSGASTAAGSRK